MPVNRNNNGTVENFQHLSQRNSITLSKKSDEGFTMKFYCSNRFSWGWSRVPPPPLQQQQQQLSQTTTTTTRKEMRSSLTMSPSTTTTTASMTTTGRCSTDVWRRSPTSYVREFSKYSQKEKRRRREPSSLLPVATSSATTTSATTTTTTPLSLSSVVLYPLACLLALLRITTLQFILATYILTIHQLSKASYSAASSSKRFNVLKMVAHLGSTMVRAVRQAWAIFVLASLLHQTVVAEGAKGGFRCDSGGNQLACLPKNYSKFELPVKQGVNDITVSIDIDEVLRINDKDYSITFACYFNVKWPEKRIHLDPEFGREQAGPGINHTHNPNIMVPMNLEFVKDLWLPNIFIYNLKTYKVIDVLNKLAGLWISATHVVFYSQATHITFICPMRFDKFPLDTQRCKFQVGSYSYDDTKMKFVTENAGYQAPKTSNSIALDYAISIEQLSADDAVFLGGTLGNFSLAGFEMVLHRYVSTYIITYYLPSGLFVIVSWISFLIPMDVIPGRMALLVTLFLVLVNIFNTVTTNTPKAEGLTAIEAWMLACILFVFGALIEYAAILFKKQRYVSATHRLSTKIVCKDNFKYEVQERQSAANAILDARQLAEEYWRIDKFFLISFPILFFIFNIIYWLAFIL